MRRVPFGDWQHQTSDRTESPLIDAVHTISMLADRARRDLRPWGWLASVLVLEIEACPMA
jgi:hypothetical protein